jgi:hypothetical protein
LLCDAGEIARSDPFEHPSSMSVSLRPAVRSELAACLLETLARERHKVILDHEQTLTLRGIEGPQKIRRLQAADLDGELNVERAAQHGQRLNRLCNCPDVLIHPRGQ